MERPNKPKKYTAVSPTGEKIEVAVTEAGTRICRSSSPEVCYSPDDPEGEAALVALEMLWHEGWKIDVE